MQVLFPFPPPVLVPVQGGVSCVPVRRIFCVGRNYAEHAREMGAVDQAQGLEPPFFFTKPADALVTGEGELSVAYPPRTGNLHHEVEMVVVLGGGGSKLTVDQAQSLILGYAVGLDLTRRDLQTRAKEKGHPWDMSKGFDQSAVCGPLALVSDCGHPQAGEICLQVNGEVRQAGDLSEMMWKVPQIIAELSELVGLAAGDLIYTGTPAGVGPLQRGDRLLGTVAGLPSLRARIV